jgi:ABC-2 type transport system permease protein
MRNVFLIAKREYLERIRTKSFIIMTVLIPLLMGAVTVGPTLLMVRMMNQGKKHYVVVVSDQTVGEAIGAQLSESQERASKRIADEKEKSLQRGAPTPPATVITDVDTNTSSEERAKLTEKVRTKEIDGVIWATDDALAAGKLTLITLDVSSFIQNDILQESIGEALHREWLKKKGLSAAEIDNLFKHVELAPENAKPGAPGAANPQMTFIVSFVMMMILYMSTLLYGINVMRAVLEEKTSRIMEVMLSIARPKEMMAGKILGVGSVGLTQFAIWALTALVFSSSTLFAAHEQLKGVLSWKVLAAFPVFFLLGYALYSTLYAAIGAMANSEQEAQQTQFIVIMPLIVSIMMAFPVMQNPGTPLAFWASMVPFCTPIVMFIRIAVQPPPLWQILLAIALNLLTLYGLVLLCARIYRVGILMYGKKPTLPEIMKWIKYA